MYCTMDLPLITKHTFSVTYLAGTDSLTMKLCYRFSVQKKGAPIFLPLTFVKW